MPSYRIDQSESLYWRVLAWVGSLDIDSKLVYNRSDSRHTSSYWIKPDIGSYSLSYMFGFESISFTFEHVENENIKPPNRHIVLKVDEDAHFKKIIEIADSFLADTPED